ncbi:M48 family metallopeptidase [Desulfovibrio sp. UCD-KL4C]|uniref:tetratricopeptide repeat protein n=1 Tax=Desulfovibrio sp. UCD-KL4C TaxID=2578120 RepID=UPI0025C5F22A|nr:tetratricopeptide repeat protein [Desulfovibrio sp. UCD-KL4C]
MYQIASLFENLPVVSHSRMVNRGYGVWMVWGGSLDDSVSRSLSDFGGMLMEEGTNQAYWFFFSNDVFRVLSRLQIWSRLNPMPVFAQLMPATLLVDYKLHLSLNVSDEFTNQEVALPNDFEVLVHPQLSTEVKKISGLNLESERTPSSLSKSGWLKLIPDQGLGYESLQNWYFILIPIGNPSDKDFIKGWRAFFSEVQVLLQKLGIQYITSEERVLLPVASLSLLRIFLRDLLILISELRNNEGEDVRYWPTVMALIPQNGMSFNDEVIRKISLDWDKLTPDCPHLRYRDAYLLGKDFAINEVRFGSEQESLDGWCNVSLNKGFESSDSDSMDVTIARRVSVGEYEDCFYCGMKNHTTVDCPSRTIRGLDQKVWKQLAAINSDKFTEGFQNIDIGMQGKENIVAEFNNLLKAGSSYESIIANALFSINSVSQLRTLYMVWRSRGKEWPNGITEQSPEEGELIWSAFESLVSGDLNGAEVLIKNAMIRFSRGYQPRSLMGFLQLELGQNEQAAFYWQEAERMSFSPLQQAYFSYLQARLQEVGGEFGEASNLYKRSFSICPNWLEPQYRRAICMVKMGFSEQAISYFVDIISKDPNYFNRILIDPELDRGRMIILQALGGLWDTAEANAKEVASGIESFSADISQWFEDGHEFASDAAQFMERMSRLAKVKNYVAFSHLISGIAKLKEEIEKRVEYEIKVINKKIEIFRDQLIEVRGEASWFPFPKLLTEFNGDFNYCATKIHWIKSQHLNVAETFRKTQKYLIQIEDRLRKLKGRLVTLRVVRDSTLFIMLLGRNFIWLEVIFLGLALLCIPLLVYYSTNVHSNFLIDMIIRQKWEFQKGLILILSILALAISAFKAAVVFEKRKRELFSYGDVDKENGKEDKGKKGKKK